MNKTATQVSLNIRLILITACILVISATLAMGFTIINKSITNNAIQGCLEASYIKTLADKSEKQEPSFYVYTLCMQDKGIVTSYK